MKRVREHINDETFFFTYGDGVADVRIDQLLEQHRQSGKLVTVTAIQPAGRYGALRLSGKEVTNVEEKPAGESWVNGGFFVLEPEVIDVVEGDHTSWEVGPLQALAAKGQVGAYQHRGFWQAMDTLRDKNQLEDLWKSGRPPWRVCRQKCLSCPNPKRRRRLFRARLRRHIATGRCCATVAPRK